MKYTKQITADILDTYCESPTDATITALARKYNVTNTAIIAKLTKHSVYRKPQKPRTRLKADIVSAIEKKLEAKLPGLDKAPKQTLLKLEEELNAWMGKD